MSFQVIHFWGAERVDTSIPVSPADRLWPAVCAQHYSVVIYYDGVEGVALA